MADPAMTPEAKRLFDLFMQYNAANAGPPAGALPRQRDMYWKLASEGAIQPGQSIDPWRDLKQSEHSDMPVIPSVGGIIGDEAKRQASRLWNSSFVPGQGFRLGEDIGTRSEALRAQALQPAKQAAGEPVLPPAFIAPPAGESHQRNATPVIEGMTPELARALAPPPQSLKTLGAESIDPPTPPSRTPQPSADVPPGMKRYTEADFNPEALKSARNIREIGRKIAADNQKAREAESFPALQAEGKKQAASDVASAVSRAELAIDADKQGMTGEQLSDYRQSLRAMNAPLREEIAKIEAAKNRAENFEPYGVWAGKKQLERMDPEQRLRLTEEERTNILAGRREANITDSPSANIGDRGEGGRPQRDAAREARQLARKDSQELVKQRAMLNAQARRLGAGGMLLPPQQDDAFGRMAPALINMMGGIERDKIAAKSAENVATINAGAGNGEQTLTPIEKEQVRLQREEEVRKRFADPVAQQVALGNMVSPLRAVGIEGDMAATLLDAAKKGDRSLKDLVKTAAVTLAPGGDEVAVQQVEAKIMAILKPAQPASGKVFWPLGV